MSVRVNVRMSKIMRTPIKVGVRAYVLNVRQLPNPESFNVITFFLLKMSYKMCGKVFTYTADDVINFNIYL